MRTHAHFTAEHEEMNTFSGLHTCSAQKERRLQPIQGARGCAYLANDDKHSPGINSSAHFFEVSVNQNCFILFWAVLRLANMNEIPKTAWIQLHPAFGD